MILTGISANGPPFRHGGSKREEEEEEEGEKRVKRSEEEKKELLERKAMYIFIYKKHNISYRYKGPRSGVSQSFMYNRRGNSTDSLSPCCDDACRSALWEQKESRVHPVMFFFFSRACVCV